MPAFWVGGYSADMAGDADGIGVLLAGASDDVLAGGALSFAGTAVDVASPSWITAHPHLDVVYAAVEGRGQVQAYRRAGERRLTPLGDPVDAGEAVCHVAVAPDGASLIACCWGDGRVVRMALDGVGRPSAPVVATAASDPYEGVGSGGVGGVDLGMDLSGIGGGDAGEALAGILAGAVDLSALQGGDPARDGDGVGDDEAGDDPREGDEVRRSRAHQARFLPAGVLATTDLGFDLVRFWRPGARSTLRTAGEVVLPRGSGPRHTVWHPSGHLYVATELSCEVFVLAPAPSGEWRIVSATSLGAGTLPADTASEIALSRDAEHVYVGVRGSDTIATVRVRSGGAELQPVALVESGVGGPRHHVVLRDTLLVAGRRSSEVASLTLDERTGVPGRVRYRVEVPSPTCILPVR